MSRHMVLIKRDEHFVHPAFNGSVSSMNRHAPLSFNLISRGKISNGDMAAQCGPVINIFCCHCLTPATADVTVINARVT